MADLHSHHIPDARSGSFTYKGYSVRECLPVFLLLLVCAGILFHDFLLCRKLYLFKDIGSDSLNLAYPQYVHLSRYLREHGFPGWSFNTGIGQDTYPLNMGDPFRLFIALFPPELVGYAIVFGECGKIILSGIIVYKAFRISLFSPMVAIVGSVLYSFSGYMILGGQWQIFSTEAFHVALMIYAFERYFRDGTTAFLILTFFMVAAFIPFNLYLISMFALLYLVFRCAGDQPPPQKLPRILMAATSSLLAGLGLAAPFFMPGLYHMLQNPRSSNLMENILQIFHTKGLFSLESPYYLATLFLRMFSNDLLGIGNTSTVWNNYLEAPLLYMGIPVILLAPLSFIGRNRRYRIAAGISLFISALILLFPFWRSLFWLGTNPYVRFAALMFSTFLLLAALHALEDAGNWGRRHVIVLTLTVAVCLELLFFPFHLSRSVSIIIEIRSFVCVLIVLYILLLVCLARFRNQTPYMALLLAIICIEVVTLNYHSVNTRPVVTRAEQEKRLGYHDYTVDAIRNIQSADRTFFRIAKDYSSAPTFNHTSFNDGMVQGYNGLSSYSSFNQPNFLRFMTDVRGIGKPDDINLRWIAGLESNNLLLTLLNTKYALTKRVETEFKQLGFEPIGRSGDVIILQKLDFIPFGYTYGRSMSADLFNRLSRKDKQIALMQACSPSNSPVQPQGLESYYPGQGMQYSQDDLRRDIADLSGYPFYITSFSPKEIAGTIRLDRPRMLVFSMPFDKGWSAESEGSKKELVMVNGGLTGLMLPAGEHRVTLTYRTPWLATGAVVSLSTAVLLFLLNYRRGKFKTSSF